MTTEKKVVTMTVHNNNSGSGKFGQSATTHSLSVSSGTNNGPEIPLPNPTTIVLLQA